MKHTIEKLLEIISVTSLTFCFRMADYHYDFKVRAADALFLLLVWFVLRLYIRC